MGYVEAPVEVRGSHGQVCGLWPFGIGTGAPLVGVPMGKHLRTSSTVCFDPSVSGTDRTGHFLGISG
ncbi:hypothetical protein QTQ03_29340 [Micromonospora sp. WMMA1363]|uniref:hypothetical protein n=1 Tax=Micromonospora sp. WMMA1363 TaxID=3053985 RepID=UPI00259C9AF0|nr:hypothetical protein [Micromonospora sp. WMMA1363]MDM4723485.1 hypothetical protein [Micromonospora sp. WMMA1363]